MAGWGFVVGKLASCAAMALTFANIAGWTLEKDSRLWPKWMSLAGLKACITVAFSLPKVSVIGGVALFALGMGIYFLSHRSPVAKL